MKKLPTILTLMLTVIGLASTAMTWQAEAQDLGVAVGAKAPNLTGTLDQSGTARDLSTVMGDKGVAVLFFRSAGW